MICDSLGLLLLSLVGLLLAVLGTVLWLYGRAYERLDTMGAFEEFVHNSQIEAQGREDDRKLYQRRAVSQKAP